MYNAANFKKRRNGGEVLSRYSNSVFRVILNEDWIVCDTQGVDAYARCKHGGVAPRDVWGAAGEALEIL